LSICSNNLDTGLNSSQILSTKQKKMINSIESKLDEYNEKSNFTNINMIPKAIDHLIRKEKSVLINYDKLLRDNGKNVKLYLEPSNYKYVDQAINQLKNEERLLHKKLEGNNLRMYEYFKQRLGADYSFDFIREKSN